MPRVPVPNPFPLQVDSVSQEEMSFCSINMVKFLMDEGVQLFFEFIYLADRNTGFSGRIMIFFKI